MAKPDSTGGAPRGSASSYYCMDRAFGHDWDEPTWEDGPDVKDGRRTVYVHHRVCRCVRCGSVRTEVFEQAGRTLAKVANRYRYSKEYEDRTRMAPGEVHTALWREETAAK